jgi:hypothetical protein
MLSLRSPSPSRILAEYPGYGPRADKPGEANFIHDASELISLAHGQYDGPLLLVGESLGAGIEPLCGLPVGAQHDDAECLRRWHQIGCQEHRLGGRGGESAHRAAGVGPPVRTLIAIRATWTSPAE